MPHYRVVWEIDAEDMDTPRDAAEWAETTRNRPGNIAHVYDVTDEHGVTTRVDLDYERED